MLNQVVVIDDEPDYVELIEAFSAAYLINTVKLDHWEDSIADSLGPSDLLVLDIQMPNIDGMDVLIKLSEADFRGGVVLMSGSEEALVDTVSNLVEKLDLRLIGTLRKPFRLAHFKQIIDTFRVSLPKHNHKESNDDVSGSQNELIAQIVDEERFYPVFQPQIDPVGSKIVGLECLTRLDPSIAGELSIPQFIQALTKTKRINDYTLRFIDLSLKALRPIYERYELLTVSFNIDASSLDHDFTIALIDVVSKHPISLSRVTFEITESSILRMDSEALYCVSKIRVAGINLSLDDFGTGYSTIQSLLELPINELKIDKSFLNKIETNRKAIEIISALIMLSSRLGFKLVCEGVETKHQLTKLMSVECSIIQGFYFSEPLPLSRLEVFAKSFSD